MIDYFYAESVNVVVTFADCNKEFGLFTRQSYRTSHSKGQHGILLPEIHLFRNINTLLQSKNLFPPDAVKRRRYGDAARCEFAG